MWSRGRQAGTIYVLNGTNGARRVVGSHHGRQVIGSPVTADLTGGGYQDVIVPTTDGIDIFDGRSGAEVATLGPGDGFQSSPLVTDDPDGHIGITGAGYIYSARQGASSALGDRRHEGSGSSVYEAGAWPQFHHDPQLTGDAGTPAPTIRGPLQRARRRAQRLPALRLGRWRLQLRQHPLLRFDRQHPPEQAGGSAALTQTAAATGRWLPTAACSPSATPGSTASMGGQP